MQVFQGLSSIRPGQCPDAKLTLTRLWVHENMRVFHDRLICNEDKTYFTTVGAKGWDMGDATLQGHIIIRHIRAAHDSG